MRRITQVCLPQSTAQDAHSQQWWLQIDQQDRIVDLGVMPDGSAMAGESWGGDVLKMTLLKSIKISFKSGLDFWLVLVSLCFHKIVSC